MLLRYQQAEVDVRIVARDEYGSALHLATGSAAHVAAVRAKHGATRVCAREEEVYSQAGLAWIAPELRHANGEIEAAASGALPRLVSREDIRGDLHMHTTYSDGRDALAAMVRTAAALGYEYIAITDHSTRAAASRTLTLDALERQRDEIARLRERSPGMTILHGIEVDILPDGRLDFEDAVLASLDIVLASLHDHAGHDAQRLTRRCLAAIATRWSTSSRTRPISWSAATAATISTSTPSTPPPPKPAPRSRSTARRAIWTWTASARARQSPPASRSRSTVTATRRPCSIGRCGSGSGPPAGAGSSRGTC